MNAQIPATTRTSEVMMMNMSASPPARSRVLGAEVMARRYGRRGHPASAFSRIAIRSFRGLARRRDREPRARRPATSDSPGASSKAPR